MTAVPEMIAADAANVVHAMTVAPEMIVADAAAMIETIAADVITIVTTMIGTTVADGTTTAILIVTQTGVTIAETALPIAMTVMTVDADEVVDAIAGITAKYAKNAIVVFTRTSQHICRSTIQPRSISKE